MSLKMEGLTLRKKMAINFHPFILIFLLFAILIVGTFPETSKACNSGFRLCAKKSEHEILSRKKVHPRHILDHPIRSSPESTSSVRN